MIGQSSSKCPGLSSRTVWSVTWSPAATLLASTTKLSKIPVFAPKSYVFLSLVPCKEGEMGRTIFFFRFLVFCQLLSVISKRIENILATFQHLLNKSQSAGFAGVDR